MVWPFQSRYAEPEPKEDVVIPAPLPAKNDSGVIQSLRAQADAVHRTIRESAKAHMKKTQMACRVVDLEMEKPLEESRVIKTMRLNGAEVAAKLNGSRPICESSGDPCGDGDCGCLPCKDWVAKVKGD